eukprot:2566218-Prymnesium_polylepis.1
MAAESRLTVVRPAMMLRPATVETCESVRAPASHPGATALCCNDAASQLQQLSQCQGWRHQVASRCSSATTGPPWRCARGDPFRAVPACPRARGGLRLLAG